MRREVALSILCAAIAGCASRPPVQAPDSALTSIDQSAREIQQAWNVLGNIDKARNPEFRTQLDDYGTAYPKELEKRVTFRWAGDIKPVVDLLSKNAGLELVIVGNPPPTAIPIAVDVQEARIGDVLRNIGYQAGRRAGVRVVTGEGHDRLELSYVPLQ